MKRVLLFPLAALLLACLYGPADGQDPAPVHPQTALSQVLPRVFAKAAPHLVVVRPRGETRAVRRRGRSGVVIAKGAVFTSANNVDVFGLDDLVVEDATGAVYTATMRGRDLRTRLVLLSCPDLPAPPAPRAGDVRAGTLGLALGAVLRLDGAPTGTFGIVSATDRFQGRADQIDAAIDPSNVGGGFFDLEGKLLGVLVSVDPRLGDRSGVGFSIPTHLLETSLEPLMEGKQLEPADFGFGLSKVGAVEVRTIDPTGPAAAAGLCVGDRILEIAARKTPTLLAFRQAAAFTYGGQTVAVLIQRGEAKRTIEMRLATKE
jgi:putative serine protease PepD